MESIAGIIKLLRESGIHIFLVDGKLKSRSAPGSMTPALGELIRKNKEQLVLALASRQLRALASDLQPSSEHIAPLSYAQQRLWFLHQLDTNSNQYNMLAIYSIEGEMDLSAIETAFQTILRRHQILRTIYRNTRDGSVQLVIDAPDFCLSICRNEQPSLSNDSYFEDVLRNEAGRVFDLNQELPIRVTFVEPSYDGDKSYLIVNIHHIAADGWSLEILMNEFQEIYSALIDNGTPQIKPLEIQYKDYAFWQNKEATRSIIETQLGYWADELKDLPPVHGLPLGFTRSVNAKKSASTLSISSNSQVARAIRHVAKEWNVTPFMLFHAALSLVIAKNSNRSTVVVGTPVANRCHERFDTLVGFFVNTLVLKLETDFDSARDYLNHVKEKHLLAQENQDIPFDSVVERLGINRSPDITPIFQIMLTTADNYHQNNGQPSSYLTLGGAQLRPVESPQINARFDLEVDISFIDNSIVTSIIYDNRLFEDEYVSRLLGQVVKTIEYFSEAPINSLSAWEMMSDEDRALLNEVNTNPPWVKAENNTCLHNLFIESVLANPNTPAVHDDVGLLTYIDLYSEACSLAKRLQSLGLLEEEPVAIRLPKGRWQVICTLAVMMSGGCYLPLERSWPNARCEKVMKKSGSRYLLVADLDDALDDASCIVITESKVGDEIKEVRPPEKDTKTSPNQLAYIIFTSGSTGEPKGVAIEHGSAVNTIVDINKRFGVTSRDKVLAVSALSFDLSVYDIFGILAAGGEIVYPDDRYSTDPAHWLALVERHGVTVWNTVPVSAGLLQEQMELSHASTNYRMDKILMSGDWVDVKLPSLLKLKFPNASVYSLGGATECSIWSIFYPITSDTSSLLSVPYGKPLSNQSFYVLNDKLDRVPLGCVGELYIGGEGLAREYFRDAALTSNSFIIHPDLGIRLYRTGDLGCYLSDGNIRFLGRNDQQLKINGYRVELGEIEAAIGNVEAVDSSVVVPHLDLNQNTHIVAYLKLTDRSTCDFSLPKFQESLAEFLPNYMLPKFFVIVSSWPLSANGKLDKSALPAPELPVDDHIVAPATVTEKRISQIWCNLLGLSGDRICTNKSFFELGGNSLLAIRMAVYIREQLGFSVEIREIFSFPTIFELSKQIDRKSRLRDLRESLLEQDSIEEYSI